MPSLERSLRALERCLSLRDLGRACILLRLD
jgi:hypothetical protein